MQQFAMQLQLPILLRSPSFSTTPAKVSSMAFSAPIQAKLEYLGKSQITLELLKQTVVGCFIFTLWYGLLETLTLAPYGNEFCTTMVSLEE
jgi:hypothetical protein